MISIVVYSPLPEAPGSPIAINELSKDDSATSTSTAKEMQTPPSNEEEKTLMTIRVARAIQPVKKAMIDVTPMLTLLKPESIDD
jgi:hypothetical protein